MNLILKNPFRILGLPVTASERDIAKRISDLTIFAEMGKSKSYDTDFLFLSSLQRTPETIREASNHIEQPENKLFYALFWFWKNNNADEVAFDLLKNGDVEKAVKIWAKCVYDGNMSARNYSNVRNLSVLYLGLAASEQLPDPIKQDFLLKGIKLAGDIFNNDLSDEYVRAIAGAACSLDKEKINKSFADEVFRFSKQYPDEADGLTIQALLHSFASFPDEIVSYVTEKFTDKPIRRIEAEIEKIRKQRTDNACHSDQYGEKLYKNTRNDLTYLKRVVFKGLEDIQNAGYPGVSGFQYQIIADKLANEILQCAIDYFNTSVKQADAHDPGEKALTIAKCGASVAAGERIKSRIEENCLVMETWIKAKPERERQKEFQLLADDIAEQLNSLSETISASELHDLPIIVQNLFDRCIYKLMIIKEYFGANNPAYLKLSSAVADNASELCMTYASQTKEYANTINVMKDIGTLDMTPELRETYDKNNEILNHKRENEIMNSLRMSVPATENQRESSDGKEKSCYIATMVYGDTDAPEVLALRKFRDAILRNYHLGRLFIRLYYRYSPLFVLKFKNSKAVNKAVEILLNQFLKLRIEN